MWYVYLIRCRDGSLYCGITTDPARRLAQHQAGTAAAFTRMRGAEEMRIAACCPSRSEALKTEAAIKKYPRRQKLELWMRADGSGCAIRNNH